jgi:hypothetical protein
MINKVVVVERVKLRFGLSHRRSRVYNPRISRNTAASMTLKCDGLFIIFRIFEVEA